MMQDGQTIRCDDCGRFIPLNNIYNEAEKALAELAKTDKLYDQWTALGAQYTDLEKDRDRLRELVRDLIDYARAWRRSAKAETEQDEFILFEDAASRLGVWTDAKKELGE